MSMLAMTLLPLTLGATPATDVGPMLPNGQFMANQPEDTAPVDEDPLADDSLAEPDDSDPAEDPAAAPTEEVTAAPAEDPAAAPAAPAEDPAAADSPPKRFSEWGLMLSPGPSFMVGPNWSATGAIVRLGIIKNWWINHFYIASGPSVSYWYARDKVANDKIHLATFNAELMIGGGVAEKFAVYGHAVLGFGYLQAYDGATDLTIKFVGGKSGAGVGAQYYMIPKLSIGALADFNFLGGLAVDTMVTLTYHFGRKAKDS